MQNNIIFHCDICAPVIFDEDKIYINDIEELKKIINQNFFTKVTLIDCDMRYYGNYKCSDCENLLKSNLVDQFYRIRRFFGEEATRYIKNWCYAEEFPFIAIDNKIRHMKLDIESNKLKDVIINKEQLLDVVKEGTIIKFYFTKRFDEINNMFEFSCYNLKNPTKKFGYYIVEKKVVTKRAIK
jgi:hypothetical protein